MIGGQGLLFPQKSRPFMRIIGRANTIVAKVPTVTAVIAVYAGGKKVWDDGKSGRCNSW